MYYTINKFAMIINVLYNEIYIYIYIYKLFIKIKKVTDNNYN